MTRGTVDWGRGTGRASRWALFLVSLVWPMVAGAQEPAPGVAPVPAGPRFQLGAAGEARLVQHRVVAGNGLELSSGTMFGGSLLIGVGRYVEVAGSVASGSLNADSVQADDATLARGEAHLAILPVPWLAIRAGGALHTFTTDAAVQRWTTVRLGGEGRLRFIGGRLAGIVRFEIYPVLTVSGQVKPNRGFGAASGLTFESGMISAGLLYELERYDFPQTLGVERHEQLGSLTVMLGLKLRK